jgi:peptidyl-tRNA hydrolase
MIPGTRHNAGMMALNYIVKQHPLIFVNQWTLKKPAGGWFAEGI